MSAPPRCPRRPPPPKPPPSVASRSRRCSGCPDRSPTRPDRFPSHHPTHPICTNLNTPRAEVPPALASPVPHHQHYPVSSLRSCLPSLPRFFVYIRIPGSSSVHFRSSLARLVGWLYARDTHGEKDRERERGGEREEGWRWHTRSSGDESADVERECQAGRGGARRGSSAL